MESKSITILNLTMDELKAIIRDVLSGKEEEDEKQRKRKVRLVDCDISVRALNALRSWDIYTVGDLISYKIDDLYKIRNMGKRSMKELEDLVYEMNLTFAPNR